MPITKTFEYENTRFTVCLAGTKVTIIEPNGDSFIVVGMPWEILRQVNGFVEFVREYVETALWCSVNLSGWSKKKYTIDNLSPECLDEMAKDCSEFMEANWDDIKDDFGQAGHDFWLTRNRHGSGFWDGDWGISEDDLNKCRRLTDASHKFGGCDPYVGDDGLIYF